MMQYKLNLGNVHKGRPIFFAIFGETPTYVLYTIYYLSMYFDIPKYPKIGHI